MMNSLRVPDGWYASGSHPSHYDIGVDPETKWEGQLTVCVMSKRGDAPGAGALRQSILAESFHGQRVRFSACVRAVNVAEHAGLYLLLNGHGRTRVNVIASDTMEHRQIRGSADWTHYSLVVDVPKDGASLHYGLALHGPGGVWMSDVKFEAVSNDVPVTAEPEDDPTPLLPSNLSFAE